MYRTLLFLNCFLKFIVHKANHEIIKSGIMVLTEREKTGIIDVDVTIN
jgi:hypothetical protein